MSVDVVFETHSTSEDNEVGIMTGWLPGRLSSTGREQARELGARRADGVDAVMTFDLARAIETVNIAFGETGVPVFLDWRLRECDYGELNGTPREERMVDEPFPAGESWRQAVARVNGALDDIAERWRGRTVLIVGNIAVRWALEHRCRGVSLEELAATPFDWQPGWEYDLSPK